MKSTLLLTICVLASGCTIRHVYPSATVHHGTPTVGIQAEIVAGPIVIRRPAAAYMHPVTIRYHYVHNGQRWIRRTGPPPAHSRYHAHPRNRNTVIVNRTSHPRSTTRATRSTRRGSRRTTGRSTR
jgi:hypothetical protein